MCEYHPTCRPGRPRCQHHRPKPCCCDAYHYPHRKGSGRCGEEDERRWAEYEAWQERERRACSEAA